MILSPCPSGQKNVRLRDRQEFIRIDDLKVIRHDKRTKRGRPGLNDEVITTFQITGTIVTDLALCYEAQKTKGLFILGTNDLSKELAMQFLLDEYKSQQAVEVFIQDWKSYEGWCQLAKQQGVEGSSRGLILSLLTDHCLLLHPDQKALINRKLPALTVGSLPALECMKAIVESIEYLIKSEESKSIVYQLSKKIAEVIPLRTSAKHMSGRNLGRLEPSPSLKYKTA